MTSEVASRLTLQFRVVSSRKEYTWCSDVLSDFLVFNIGRTKRDWLFHTTSSQVHHHNLCTLFYKQQSFCASHWMTNKNHRKWTEQCKLSLLWSLRKKNKKNTFHLTQVTKLFRQQDMVSLASVQSWPNEHYCSRGQLGSSFSLTTHFHGMAAWAPGWPGLKHCGVERKRYHGYLPSDLPLTPTMMSFPSRSPTRMWLLPLVRVRHWIWTSSCRADRGFSLQSADDIVKGIFPSKAFFSKSQAFLSHKYFPVKHFSVTSIFSVTLSHALLDHKHFAVTDASQSKALFWVKSTFQSQAVLSNSVDSHAASSVPHSLLSAACEQFAQNLVILKQSVTQSWAWSNRLCTIHKTILKMIWFLSLSL